MWSRIIQTGIPKPDSDERVQNRHYGQRYEIEKNEIDDVEHFRIVPDSRHDANNFKAPREGIGDGVGYQVPGHRVSNANYPHQRYDDLKIKSEII